jgi:predicted  nucleic acid-binding Zn-ribbon protein
MKARWYVAVVAGTLMAMATTAAWSRLKPEHRETLDLAADLESSLNAVEQSAHVMLGQVERARNGLKQRSTGYTVKELAALQESCDTMSKRIKDAEQALKKLDDGRLEPDAGAVTNSGVP